MIEDQKNQDLEDRKKVRELCSKCIVELWDIMGKLQAIRDVVTAIDIPALSSYQKIEVVPIEQEVKVSASTTFVPPKKQTLTDLTMTLARNLELQLKEKKE